MTIVQLMASPFVGGPEQQMLGLATHLPAKYRTVFLSFAEGGRCQALLDEAQKKGFEAIALKHNVNRPNRAVREIRDFSRHLRADVLCCSGYKPDILGWAAARRAGIPVISISHGWTAATAKVRLNEMFDRLVLRWMDCTVCVSEAQARRVRRAGVPSERITVIRNAIDLSHFPPRDPKLREEMLGWFSPTPRYIVGAAGRLSREKGFDHLITAAALVRRRNPETGFVLFGDGPQRGLLENQIAAKGLSGTFHLAGFRRDVRPYLMNFDLLALPSHTEGLPVIVLEAMAAALPVVATAVGGTPETVEEGVTGYLVPPADPSALAQRILALLANEAQRRSMGEHGRRRVATEFTFSKQAIAYQRLLEQLTHARQASAISDDSVARLPRNLTSHL